MHYFSQPIFSLFSYLKNALHNLVIELCSAPFFENIVQVFIKFTHSFVAIELLTFCKNSKKNILLLKRALDIPYVNRINFCPFVYINVSQKKGFNINEDYDDCHSRKTTRTFIYTKSKKNCETFLYTKSETLFKKLDNFRYCYGIFMTCFIGTQLKIPKF